MFEDAKKKEGVFIKLILEQEATFRKISDQPYRKMERR